MKNIDETLELFELENVQEEYEMTLDQLPNNKSFVIEKELEYRFLTGGKKNQKGIINGNNLTIEISNNNKFRFESK